MILIVTVLPEETIGLKLYSSDKEDYLQYISDFYLEKEF